MDTNLDDGYWGEIKFSHDELDGADIECEYSGECGQIKGKGKLHVRTRTDCAMCKIDVVSFEPITDPNHFDKKYIHIPAKIFCIIERHPDGRGYLLRK